MHEGVRSATCTLCMLYVRRARFAGSMCDVHVVQTFLFVFLSLISLKFAADDALEKRGQDSPAIEEKSDQSKQASD